MPKISVSMGLNVKLRNSGNAEDRFDRFTPALTIADIDTEGDVEDQIKKGLDVAEQAWDNLSDLLEKKVNQELNRDVMST